MVAQPMLDPQPVERLIGRFQLHDRADLGDQPPRHRLQLGTWRLSAEDSSREYLTGQNAGDVRCRRPARDVFPEVDLDVEIVDDADGFAGVVEQLAVQQVQSGVQKPSRRLGCVEKVVVRMGHWPAPVTIMRGMAASDADRIRTRYIDASTLVARPLTYLPM